MSTDLEAELRALLSKVLRNGYVVGAITTNQMHKRETIEQSEAEWRAQTVEKYLPDLQAILAKHKEPRA